MRACRLSFGNEPKLNVAFGKAMELLSVKSVNEHAFYRSTGLGVFARCCHPTTCVGDRAQM
jgi:hypothetical protein